MEHLIDKSALVAEIKEWLTEIEKLSRSKESGDEYGKGFCDGRIGAYRKILSSINSLEVKEVDLNEYYHEFLQKEWFGNSHVRTVSEMMAFTAKHFFELGLRSTITEEDCKLIWTIGDELPYMSEEEFYKELLNRYKAQKENEYDRQRKTRS